MPRFTHYLSLPVSPDVVVRNSSQTHSTPLGNSPDADFVVYNSIPLAEMPFLSLGLDPSRQAVDMTSAPLRSAPYSKPPAAVIQRAPSTSEEIALFILRTHCELCALDSYEPGELINELLTNLVLVCSEVHDQETTRQVRAVR